MGDPRLVSAGLTRNIHAGHNMNSGALGAYRSTFLKKRSLSRDLRRSRSRLIWAFAGDGRVCGRAECTGADFRGAGGVGGAVKAGPLGPPVGEALRAPGVQLSPATIGSDRPLGGPGRLGVAGHSGPHHCCSGTDQGHRGSAAPAIPSSAVGRMVCSGHSQTGSLSYPGHARSAGGHGDRRARVLAVSEPAHAASGGPGSGSRRPEARSRPA